MFNTVLSQLDCLHQNEQQYSNNHLAACKWFKRGVLTPWHLSSSKTNVNPKVFCFVLKIFLFSLHHKCKSLWFILWCGALSYAITGTFITFLFKDIDEGTISSCGTSFNVVSLTPKAFANK
jgi:hypothetical protein